MQTASLLPRLAGVTLGLVLLSGCGGDTADVSGTVTMDGKPLEGASVVFTPQMTEDGDGGGRPAAGVTDSEGYYQLIYGRGTSGAIPGTYRVEIRTYREPDEDGETPEEKEGVPEIVPAQYNADTELIETVEDGGSVINFDLVSEGEIKNPPGAGGGGGGYGGGGYGGGRGY